MYKRPDGRWSERIVINGKPKYFYAKTKPDLLRKIAAYRTDQENGKTFASVADEWFATVSENLASNTLKSYTPAYKRAVARFGDYYINDIKPSQIDAYINEFALTKKQKTVKTQLSIFNLIFRYAVAKGYCLINAARDLKIPANLEKRKVTAPSSADIAAVKANVNAPFGLFPYMALFSGLRRGELQALEWSDIDLKNRTISVTKSLCHVNNRPQVKLPKSKASFAVVPIIGQLYKVLEQIPESKRTGLVFPNEDGDYMTETQFQKYWRDYCAVSGVTATPHQFRHAFATMLFENNLPPEKMQPLLRHAQFGTTMDIYTDLRQSKQKQIFDEVKDFDIT